MLQGRSGFGQIRMEGSFVCPQLLLPLTHLGMFPEATQECLAALPPPLPMVWGVSGNWGGGEGRGLHLQTFLQLGCFLNAEGGIHPLLKQAAGSLEQKSPLARGWGCVLTEGARDRAPSLCFAYRPKCASNAKGVHARYSFKSSAHHPPS